MWLFLRAQSVGKNAEFNKTGLHVEAQTLIICMDIAWRSVWRNFLNISLLLEWKLLICIFLILLFFKILFSYIFILETEKTRVPHMCVGGGGSGRGKGEQQSDSVLSMETPLDHSVSQNWELDTSLIEPPRHPEIIIL